MMVLSFLQLIQNFAPCVIRSDVSAKSDDVFNLNNKNKCSSERVFSFMLDCASEIMTIPDAFKDEVERKQQDVVKNVWVNN